MDGPMGGTAAAVESACGQFGILIRYKNRPNLQTHTHTTYTGFQAQFDAVGSDSMGVCIFPSLSQG